jgi:hypothetical protein
MNISLNTSALPALAMAIFLVCAAPDVKGQDENPWPSQSSAIGVYLGTLGVATPLNLTYDHLWTGERVYGGLVSGVTLTFLEDFRVLGVYLAGVLLTGMDRHHFELRLGASYHPLELYPDAGAYNDDLPFIPVITLGYRFQESGANRFYRISAGTGGIGVGMGFIFRQKNAPTLD